MKVLLVDDEQLIRSALKIMLEMEEDIEIIGEASNGQEAYEQALSLEPDIILMDIRMPKLNGIEALKKIRDQLNDVPVLFLTTFQDVEYIIEAMNLGASGYLLKDSSSEAIADGLRLALSGKVVMDSEVSTHLMTHSTFSATNFKAEDYGLNDKELEIMKLVAQGKNNKEIAASLFLSEGTIKNNISIILQKLNLRDRTQLAIFVLENKIQ